VGHEARTGQMRCVYRVLVGEPEGKSLFGIPKHRCGDVIKIVDKSVGWTCA
jgi:hypothetical protein